MPVKKPTLRKKKKKVDGNFLTPDQIKDSLWSHGWLNNTQSPVSTKPFWNITKNIVPSDEVPYSAIFATSYTSIFLHKQYVFLATDRRIIVITNLAGVISAKAYRYDDVTAIDLFVDRWLKSMVYADIYLSKFRFYKLETNDPTSTIHFKQTVFSVKNSGKKRRRFKPIAGSMGITSKMATKTLGFVWHKLMYIKNFTKRRKTNRDAKRLAKQAQESNIKQAN